MASADSSGGGGPSRLRELMSTKMENIEQWLIHLIYTRYDSSKQQNNLTVKRAFGFVTDNLTLTGDRRDTQDKQQHMYICSNVTQK